MSSTELIGYLASALVVVSLAMTSVVRLRVVSLVGSVVFVVYGALLGSIPIILTNAAISVLNVWFLTRELGSRDLGAVPIAGDAPFLTDFLRSHLADIHGSQPSFTPESLTGDEVCLLLTRDGLPAGAVVGRRQGDVLEVSLDYVMAAYRDSRIGQWLYGPGAKVLRGLGVARVMARPETAGHRSYLTGVGFVPAPGEPDALTRSLT